MASSGTPTPAPRVLLGVCGGIAAYKAVLVLRGLMREGCDVSACLTESATRFVAPLTFAAISGHPVAHGRFGQDSDAAMAHVEETRGASLFVVAPATANLLGKLAAGIADDWLTTHLLASTAPLLLAPSMNVRMWGHAAVQENVRTLARRGAVIVEPEEGELACGETGAGRLADPARIVAEALRLLAPALLGLAGRRVLVTAGPTFEDIDPVRFVGNRSSGRMGCALAAEAVRAGAEVVLVLGPTSVVPPAGCRVLRVRSAEEMAGAVRQELATGSDLAVMAAAVADYRPAAPSPSKLKREGNAHLDLSLERTPDVLAEVVASGRVRVVVGFAAETDGDLEAAARTKLDRKGCDLVVANRVGGPDSAFDAESSEVLVVRRQAPSVRLERARKSELARGILSLAAETLATLDGTRP